MNARNTVVSTVILAALVHTTCETISGQALEALTIGTQTWALHNLDVSHFQNGDPIPEARTTEEWDRAGNDGTPAWSHYDNDSEHGKRYGKLYNWFAVNDPRGLARRGWHVASNEEWNVLARHVGGWGVAGLTLMSASGWAYNENGTNESGFNGLPAGARSGFKQRIRSGETVSVFIFRGVGSSANWWSSSEYRAGTAWFVTMYYDGENGLGMVQRGSSEKEGGLSVRVLKGSSRGGADLLATTDESSVEIPVGSQIWAARNLDVTHFRNGDAIPEAATAEEWTRAGNNGMPAWSHYDSDPEKTYQAALNGKTYGKLYNWFAVNDPRGLAPEGWHVPSDPEWTTLLDHLRYGIPIPQWGQFNLIEGTERQPTRGSVNESGFAGLAGGYRGSLGTFASLGISGNWWSATGFHSDDAWDRELRHMPNRQSPEGTVGRYDVSKARGLSVRLLRN